MSDTPNKLEQQDQIQDADWKLAEQKQNVGKLREMIADEIESMPAAQEVKRLVDELERVRKQLETDLLGNRQVNDLKDRLASENSELKARRVILSGLIVQYIAAFRVRSVEVDKENRELIVTGKLGRKIKEQMELPL